MIYICPSQPPTIKATMPGIEKMGEKVKTATNFANMLRLSPSRALNVSETVLSTVQTD